MSERWHIRAIGTVLTIVVIASAASSAVRPVQAAQGVTPPAQNPAVARPDVDALERREAMAREEGRTNVAERRREGVRLWLEAAEGWARLGVSRREAAARVQAAIVQTSLGDRKGAMTAYERAIEIYRTLDDPGALAHAMNGLAPFVRQGGDERRALALYEEALALARQGGNRALESSLLHNLGGLHFERTQLTDAYDHYTAALELRRALADGRGAGESLIGLARVRRNMGFTEEAIALATQAIALKQQAGDLDGEARALQNLGVSYERLGALADAMQHYEQALAIVRRTGNRRAESAALRGAAFVSRQLGDPIRMRQFAEAALAIARETGELLAIGDALLQFGAALAAAGDHAGAAAHYAEALEHFRQIGNAQAQVSALRLIARLDAEAGRFDEAIVRLQEALPLARDTGHLLSEARTLEDLGAIELQRGRPEAAIPLLSDALASNATLRAAVSLPDRRATLQAVEDGAHRLLVRAHLELHRRQPAAGHLARAFELSDRGRARSLRELVIETRTELGETVPAELATRHRQLRDLLSARTQALLALPPKAPTRPALQAEVTSLERQFEALDADIRARDPRYAALINPPLRPMRELQALLPAGTTALHYAVNADGSFVFVVEAGRLAVHALPRAADIERAAVALVSRLHAGPGRAHQAGVALAADELADQILGPVARALSGRRVVVIPDGVLQYVPFAMLPRPGTGRPLVETHEVVILPSLSSALDLRALDAARATAPRSALVFGDPVLRASDARVGRSAASATPTLPRPDALVRAMRAGGLQDLDRLPYTRREASAIAALAGQDAALLLDFEASRDRLLGGDLADYRVLHIATHGLIDSRQPSLSGLVLSLVDADGRPRQGLVTLRDIYALRLHADLVVLSACRTALGAAVRGEGLIGLTRGFMHAGAPRVVASLWDVRDDSTAVLMEAFYDGLLKRKLSASAALRQAQLTLRRDPRFASPYHWAGFVLHGHW